VLAHRQRTDDIQILEYMRAKQRKPQLLRQSALTQ
jgi:hypothetical protein